MTEVALNKPAPDFSLPDYDGKLFHLAEQRGKEHIVLVFNRGFF